MRRLAIWLVLALLVVAGAAGAAWWWLRGAGGKAELEVVLSEALGREVRIGSMQVDPRGHVTLHDVDVGHPPDWVDLEGAPMLHADVIDLDVALSELLDREVVGVVTASAVQLRVVKRGGTHNLDGLVRPRREGAEPIDLHLDVAIRSSGVLLEDHDRQQSLELAGVDVRALLSNRDGERRTSADVAIAEVGLHGLPVRQVAMTLRADGSDLAIEGLRAGIGERGTFTGSGRLFLADARDWTITGEIAEVDLDADVRRVVAVLYPPLSSSVEATAATGKLGAMVSLAGAGLHWAQIRPTLTGKGTLRLTDVVLPKGSLLLGLAALAGRPDAPWSLAQADVVFSLADEWVTLDRVTADGQSTSLPITGRVSLEGQLDLTADLMPLVAVFGGGVYREVAKVATSLPVRIHGTVQKPELAPPSVSDVGKSLLGGALRRALGPK